MTTTRAPASPIIGHHSPSSTSVVLYWLARVFLKQVYRDILAFSQRLHQSGTPVETHRWRRQVHAFPVLARLLPESRKAIMLTGQFLRAALE